MNLSKYIVFFVMFFVTSTLLYAQCLNESFSNIGNSGSYLSTNWIGDNGHSFNATDARTDQTINGKAITIRDGSLTVNGVIGGIGDLTVTTKRIFSGGSGNLNVFVNGTPVGVIPYGATVQTTTLTGINTLGAINLEIQTPSNGDRIGIDDLSWTCFSSTNIITTDAISNITYTVDCISSATGTVDFSSVGTFAAGNIFTAEISDASGSFASPTVIGTFAASGVDPSGTINFTIPANFTSGTGYRIRVLGDNPTTIGTDNGTDITITNSLPCPPPSISNTVSSTAFTVDCTTSATGTVNSSALGSHTAGNTFTAAISDASGSFASPTVIGTFAASGVDPSGTINITIPANFIAGTGYRIRVLSDTPVITGSDNGSNITITNSAPCTATLPSSGGLLINEFSNGSSGNKEYYEFIVAGECGAVIDVSGYIIDDNNGTFSTPGSYPAGSGIASGYLQLTNHAQWTAIPVGSVIVVFNADDRNPSLPADDPYDSDSDSLYVIPHNNTALFIIRNDIPNASLPDSTYFPTSSTSSSWDPLGIANSGDAIQVRQPNGDYFFGISYGKSSISGGPDGTKISGSSLGGNNGYFSDGDFRDVTNWTVGDAGTDETPGTYND